MTDTDRDAREAQAWSMYLRECATKEISSSSAIIRAMLSFSDPEQAAPVGWKLVPVNGTQAMFDAMEEVEHPNNHAAFYAALWDAALDAAPTPPVISRDEEVERLREALANIVAHFDDQEEGPGHSHYVPGVWDSNNIRELAGQPCVWCRQWKAARAALGSQP